MPKVSVRQKKIAALQETVQRNRLQIAQRILEAREEDWDNVVDKAIEDMVFDEAFLELDQVLSSRYLQTPGQRSTTKISATTTSFDYDAFISDEETFSQTVRMTRQNFDSLVTELEDHAVYQSKGLRPQSNFKVQIVLVLDRIGSRGIGNSVGRLARTYGVSEGSVVMFTKRFFEAVSSLQTKYLSWPTDHEKTEIKSANTAGFKDCIGVIDGFTADLAWKPSDRPNLFLSRKNNKYSLQSIGICDHNKRIRYLETGFYGSRSDAEVYTRSHIGKHPAEYFSGNEYLLGDTHYALNEQIITPFSNADSTENQRQFNQYHARMCETAEQTFSLLKTRFQSLDELPLQIKNMTTDIAATQEWVLVCVLLHNRQIMSDGADIDLEQSNTEEEPVDEDSDSEMQQQPERNEVEINEKAQLKRESIMSETLQLNS